MKLLFDIETNGLYDTVSELWIAVVKDIETNKTYTFSDHDKTGHPLSEFLPYLEKADTLIGHNIIGYDLPVIHKLLGWEPTNTKLVDTMIISQMNNYRREGRHSLGNFGKLLNFPKGESPDFLVYSDEMKKYAINDVELNHKVYKYVVNEAQTLISNRPTYKTALQTEHKIAEICANQVKYKWNFDTELAKKHYIYLTGEMKIIEDAINPTLKPRKVFIDKENKFCKYLQDGRMSAVSARMLSEFLGKTIEQSDTKSWDPKKSFRRFKMVEADLGNMDQVRGMLLDAGWVPSQFTPKGEPKITEDSLPSIKGDMGKQVLHYYSLRSRHSVIKGWIELAEANNNKVYVEAFNIGTPTFRQRHSKIVNVPSSNSFFGKEMRELFIADTTDHVVVGCDSSGNQIRALGHYLNNKDVTEHILNGDIHQRTADIVGVARPVAKSLLYATIFGAGFAKLGKMVLGYEDVEKGKEVKDKLYTAFPGLKELTRRLNSFFHTTEYKGGVGFIPALDGRKIYAETSFKLLNYLLQSYEAITVKTAVANAFEMFKLEKLDVRPLGLVHDEIQLQCNKKDIKRVSEILEYSFGDYITKTLKLNIQMAGEAKVGKSWFETH